MTAAREDDMNTTLTDITIRFCDGDLLTDDAPTRDAVDRYAEMVAEAVASDYPGAKVEVNVERDTSGMATEVAAQNADGPVWNAEDAILETTNRVWEQWCEGLTENDMTTDTIKRDGWTLYVLNDEPASASVRITKARVPLVLNNDGELEQDYGNADWPSDDEVCAAISEALGRPVVVEFFDAGDTLDEGIYHEAEAT
jgi:GH15 family glucan-1,4-alpha-glucosidase